MFGFETIAMTGLLTLASAAEIKCTVPKAPVISINPVSRPVKYDFSRSSKQLTGQKSNTVSPYAPDADTTTGGLRHDQPTMKFGVQWGYVEYPTEKAVCLWYDSVTVDIELKPQIFIAKEYSKGPCRDAILEHERKHVVVDREVMNKYAQEIGAAIQEAINQAGALGPYNLDELETIQKQLVEHVQSAVSSRELILTKEMRARQQTVDSLEEYERVNAICQPEMLKKRR